MGWDRRYPLIAARYLGPRLFGFWEIPDVAMAAEELEARTDNKVDCYKIASGFCVAENQLNLCLFHPDLTACEWDQRWADAFH